MSTENLFKIFEPLISAGPVAVFGSIGLVIAALWLMVIAFRESILCGFLYLFLPIYNIYYLFSRWRRFKTWQPFSVWLVCFVMMVFAITNRFDGEALMVAILPNHETKTYLNHDKTLTFLYSGKWEVRDAGNRISIEPPFNTIKAYFKILSHDGCVIKFLPLSDADFYLQATVKDLQQKIPTFQLREFEGGKRIVYKGALEGEGVHLQEITVARGPRQMAIISCGAKASDYPKLQPLLRQVSDSFKFLN